MKLEKNLLTKAFLAAGVGLFLLVFLKNAWVSEDAYIMFRSIEQLFAGNGPRWNPHERVQVFTSMFWFWVLAALRVFSTDVFLNALVASLLCSAGTLAVLWATLHDSLRWGLAVLLLLCSRAFMDYTTSGLENPLGYLTVAGFLYFYTRAFRESSSKAKRRKSLVGLLALAGLSLLVRHDLATLLFLPTAYAFWHHRDAMTYQRWVGVATLSLLPFVLWSLFALIYYGSIFPNTAYAKLNTGIARPLLLMQGVKYLEVSIFQDTITIFVIGVSIVCLSFRSKAAGWLAAGIAVNVLYVVYIGGDFMQGRFLSYAYLLAPGAFFYYEGWRVAQPVARSIGLRPAMWSNNTFLAVLCVFFGAYSAFYPNAPAQTPLDYKRPIIESGIADERGFYFDDSSLFAYLTNDAPYFPLHTWSRKGRALAEQSKDFVKQRYIGFFGYWAGTEKVIIDPLALSDPFLARLPTGKSWRIGHFPREVPAAYATSIKNDTNAFRDPCRRALYGDVKLATQDEALFSQKRWHAILRLNSGYDFK